MTLKERISDHRNQAACRSCHARIDPWGIAFENYDALGAFRTSINSKPVDSTAELFNRQTLAGIDGLKRYLLTERQDQFARAVVHKLTAYALGSYLGVRLAARTSIGRPSCPGSVAESSSASASACSVRRPQIVTFRIGRIFE